jgi:hypothetical protein
MAETTTTGFWLVSWQKTQCKVAAIASAPIDGCSSKQWDFWQIAILIFLSNLHFLCHKNSICRNKHQLCNSASTMSAHAQNPDTGNEEGDGDNGQGGVEGEANVGEHQDE